MEASFWKPQSLPAPGSLNMVLDPLGKEPVVLDMLLSIPRTYPWLSPFQGCYCILWDVGQGVEMHFRAEPELGGSQEDVFSITTRGSAGKRDFFRLYLQVFEMLGATLLQNGEFIPIDIFKKRM